MKSLEHQHQVALFNWAAVHTAQYPALRYMYAIPNGGQRDIRVAMRLKREGVRKGVLDVCLPYPCGKWHGLYIEMKAGKNKLTKEQAEYKAWLDQCGYYTAVCYAWIDAAMVIKDYLEGKV